jgi:hypothetical protein
MCRGLGNYISRTLSKGTSHSLVNLTIIATQIILKDPLSIHDGGEVNKYSGVGSACVVGHRHGKSISDGEVDHIDTLRANSSYDGRNLQVLELIGVHVGVEGVLECNEGIKCLDSDLIDACC